MLKMVEVHSITLPARSISQSVLNELIKSMQANGFDATKPVVMRKQSLIDGMHRVLAARAVGIQVILARPVKVSCMSCGRAL